jgi:flagellar biosynthesis/type III secretory pathway chaperone
MLAMAPERVYKDLLDHLNSEVEHLEDQQRVLMRERENLMQRELEGILDCVKEKETLEVQWRILRESRRILRQRLADALGCPEREMNLGLVIDRTDEPTRSHLSALKGRIEDLLAQVERLTEGNGYLIRAALGHVSRSIAFLSQLQGTFAQTYNGEGRMMKDALVPSRVQQQA